MLNTTWKTVRVFISSTFRDMQAERDHLVRFVFPKLREQLLPLRIHLVDVDLRWGVTSEQDTSEACREIIDECRPRFLCILGGRYGWIPPGKTHSITSDEVYYSVLDRPLKDRIFALFYFRDDSATAQILETTPGEYQEPPGSDNQIRLTTLKQEIVDANLNPFTYHARWDNSRHRLTGLREFGNRVFSDLLNSIKTDPEFEDRFLTTLVDNQEEYIEENLVMDSFAEERCERFVLGSRETILNKLLSYIDMSNDPGYIFLTGSSGSGKSALLAHLSQHLEQKTQPTMLLVRHFVGASPNSTNQRLTLKRLCHELKRRSNNITAEIPDDKESLQDTFHEFLRLAGEQKHVVLILDAIDHFDSISHSAELDWLPEKLPNNVHIILSSLDGQIGEKPTFLHHIHKIELLPLTADDGEAIIQQFSRRYRKKFDPCQRAALLAKTDIGTPLYLLTALEELRTLGTYEEITQRIQSLPSTTQELFSWILDRLKDDDGFRDAEQRPIGHILVSRFAALLSASRYGLSQRELTDLLDPGDTQGNIAALLLLLRPYLMYRGELFDFYHGQFRIAVESARLKTDPHTQVAHAELADYFRKMADPDDNQLWKLNPRMLNELPFHVASAKQAAELRALLSQLAFLSARVATGGIYEQIADYYLAGSPLPADLTQWHDFLQKHAQRLARNPSSLIALANHEGFSEARLQAENVPWQQPWLRTSPEKMPSSKFGKIEGLQVQVTGSLDFSWGRPSALAPHKNVAFSLEQLGAIRVFDLNEMRQIEGVLSIHKNRPLVLACAPDAKSLTIFYESGKAILYRCLCGRNGRPSSLEQVVEFNYYLPEFEDPVVVWHDNTFWYQSAKDRLASISVEKPDPFEETIPSGQCGEISALVFTEKARLIAVRQDSDSVLFAPGTPPLRQQTAHVTAATACGEKQFAVAFSNGALVIYELDDKLRSIAEIRAGLLRGTLGWDGTHLLWVTENNKFRAWCLKDDSPLSVQDNQEIFPSHLHILPRQWFLQPDDSLLLGTTHSLVAFRVLHGGIATDGRIQEIFGGPVWRTVRKKRKDQWLLEGHRPNEILLGHDVKGRLYCALDGKGLFFAASGYGPGLVLNLATLQSKPLVGCPLGINGAVGEDNGGCWFTDRIGDIYFADSSGQCRCITKIGLSEVHGSFLENCGEYLVWLGYSNKFFSDTGPEPARTFIFFHKHKENFSLLKRQCEHFRHPKEGFCVAACFDQITERLITLWTQPTDGIATYCLRVGSIAEFLLWQIQEIGVSGLGAFRFVQAKLSANGQYLGVLNMSGEISCLSVLDGRVIATLACSTPFNAVAPGPEGAEFWLVEARSNVYKCSLSKGTK